MQNELLVENPQTTINILGVNQVGAEAGNPLICEGRDLPWLQDNVDDLVWGLWEALHRDVYILDGANRRVSVFSLTQFDLDDPANYAELKRLLKEAAGE